MKEDQKAKIVKELRELLPPGTTVYTKLNHVSSSGMMRVIEVMIFKDNEPRYLTYSVADILDYKLHNKYEGLKVHGCGMDMGFSVVYNLSAALYREIGYSCLNDENGHGKCPAAYHANSRPYDGTNKNEPIHHDGYALRHRWV